MCSSEMNPSEDHAVVLIAGVEPGDTLNLLQGFRRFIAT
jgi:hypothetical protein